MGPVMATIAWLRLTMEGFKGKDAEAHYGKRKNNKKGKDTTKVEKTEQKAGDMETCNLRADTRTQHTHN